MFGLSKRERAAAEQRKRDERVQAELARLHAIGRAEAEHLRELEREQRRQAAEQERQQREHERLLREQERQAKEQERQAAQLAKHERRIADLEYRMKQAEQDIAHYTETLGNLCALLDIEQAEQAAAVPGSKTDIKCQKRIITLNNQIHTAETRLNKAKHTKNMTSIELRQ